MYRKGRGLASYEMGDFFPKEKKNIFVDNFRRYQIPFLHMKPWGEGMETTLPFSKQTGKT